MKPNRVSRVLPTITFASALWVSGLDVGLAQTFSSGSTGALGALAPTANVAITLPPDGVLHYTTVSIPSGVTVTFVKNAANTPVTILATGDIAIAGTISLKGGDGQPGQASATAISVGGAGGPGAFRGGNGSSLDFSSPAATGQGPGGGAGAPSTLNQIGQSAANGAASLLPLIGGSGGGGGAARTANGVPTFSGNGGGGGGGAAVLASSTKILLTGTITVDGGNGGNCGHGSGGAIRLVAPVVTGTGSLSAVTPSCSGVVGASGRISVEAFTNTFTGTSSPAASLSASPGPVTTASMPALINLPTLAITSVGGMTVPTVPTGSYTTVDLPLPVGTTNPVPVTLAAVNTPLSTPLTVRVVPVAGSATTVSASALSGTFTSSTATASVTLPTGGLASVLNAYASLTLTAGLLPQIEGEEVEQVVLGAAIGTPSTLTLVTKSGKEVPMSALPIEEQGNLARAFEAMRSPSGPVRTTAVTIE